MININNELKMNLYTNEDVRPSENKSSGDKRQSDKNLHFTAFQWPCYNCGCSWQVNKR